MDRGPCGQTVAPHWPRPAPTMDAQRRISAERIFCKATAPTTFKMEDYRKTMRDGLEVLTAMASLPRWLFLMAAAWFNMTMQRNNTLLQNQVATVTQKNNEMVICLQ